MEVFTDAADPAVFCLVTRWTDAGSFEGWHKSEAHRLSHKYMPKGLKLVPGFTEVSRLERLPTDSRPLSPEEVVADAAPVLAHYLTASRTAHLLIAAPDGMMRFVNSAMAVSLGVPQSELVGRPVWGLLTDHDADLLRSRSERGDRDYAEPLLLNFVDARHSPFTLECRCDVQPGYFVLIGEPPGAIPGAAPEDWLGMNNQLTVLARENARQNKELQQTKRELEHALVELQSSHWHLKKLQEVLPLCMECGKVKSGAKWESVVQYLKDNALFLSHGYCPDCLAVKIAQWGLPGVSPEALSS